MGATEQEIFHGLLIGRINAVRLSPFDLEVTG